MNMSLIINHVVVHELIKERDKTPRKPKTVDDVLPTDNPIVIKLVQGISDIYGKKNNSADYGVFTDSGTHGTFPENFSDYHRKQTQEASIFIELSKSVMKDLHRSVISNMPATGGYIVFADYYSANDRFFVIAMLKDKSGLRMSQNLVPEELDTIDLKHLHQAAKISYKKYSKFLTATTEEKMELNYLSFVSPASSKKVAGYFITSLGCKKGTASAQATKLIVSETARFFRENEAIGDEIERKEKSRKVKERIISYLHECISHERTAKLSEIDSIARELFPSEDTKIIEDLSDSLYERLNSDEIGIPNEFSVNKDEVKKYTTIKHESSNWKFEFRTSSLGCNENAEVQYSKNNKSLTINNISDDLREKIEQDLIERGIFIND